MWTAPPFGTLIVNLAGSFLIAFIVETMPASEWRVMLTTGVIGGFTTYSAFNLETTSYFRSGAWLIGFANIAATLVGCLLAGAAGIALARTLR